MQNKRNINVRFFSSFEEENIAEYKRRRRMSYNQRMKEFSSLQERQWGTKWTSEPIVKKVSYEKVDWY